MLGLTENVKHDGFNWCMLKNKKADGPYREKQSGNEENFRVRRPAVRSRQHVVLAVDSADSANRADARRRNPPPPESAASTASSAPRPTKSSIFHGSPGSRCPAGRPIFLTNLNFLEHVIVKSHGHTGHLKNTTTT